MVPGKGRAGLQGGTSSEFRQVDSVQFEVLVAGRGLDYEEGSWPSLHKLVGSWSRSPDETKAGRNQSACIHGRAGRGG